MRPFAGVDVAVEDVVQDHAGQVEAAGADDRARRARASFELTRRHGNEVAHEDVCHRGEDGGEAAELGVGAKRRHVRQSGGGRTAGQASQYGQSLR